MAIYTQQQNLFSDVINLEITPYLLLQKTNKTKVILLLECPSVCPVPLTVLLSNAFPRLASIFIKWYVTRNSNVYSRTREYFVGINYFMFNSVSVSNLFINFVFHGTVLRNSWFTQINNCRWFLNNSMYYQASN